MTTGHSVGTKEFLLKEPMPCHHMICPYLCSSDTDGSTTDGAVCGWYLQATVVIASGNAVAVELCIGSNARAHILLAGVRGRALREQARARAFRRSARTGSRHSQVCQVRPTAPPCRFPATASSVIPADLPQVPKEAWSIYREQHLASSVLAKREGVGVH